MDAHALECLDYERVRAMLAGQASCALGRGLAESMQPINRRELIERWFRQVGELDSHQAEHGLPPFGGISDIRELVKRCAPPLRVTVDDVAEIGRTLRGTHEIARYLAKLPESAAELRHLADRVGDFQTVSDRIDAIIDERGHVRDNASDKLALIRRAVQRAQEAIEGAVERLLRDPGVRRLLQYQNHTFHGERLVLPVRAECRGRLDGIVHRMSDSGATIYVEPKQAVELNNEISELRIAENEEINRILWDLAHEIHINAEPIVKTLDALAVIDLIVAKVRLMKLYQLRCPELVDEPHVDVRQARHPILLEMFRQRAVDGAPLEEVVPIDYRLGGAFDLLVVTGPNTGGKTVALKTIGLLSLMAQSGVPVPVAAGSKLGLFSNILIDIGDEQSMQQSLSTFSGHMRRMLDMLKRAGPKTLVLVDELGAGTDPEEGGAIGRAMLDELLRLEAKCVVTTHIGALKTFALDRERAENGSAEFDVESLRPTYKLRIGEAGSSNAIEIAHRLGMSKRLVAAARKNMSEKSRGLKSALQSADRARRHAEEVRDAAASAQAEIDRRQLEVEAERQRLQKQQSDFRTWVARVVNLQPGDQVRVRNFDRDGTIVRLKLDQQRAEVDVGAFSVEVPLADVLPPKTVPPPAPERPKPSAADASGKGKKPKRGQKAPGQKAPSQAPGSSSAAGKGESAATRRAVELAKAHADASKSSSPVERIPVLSERQIAALQEGDEVYAIRFERVGHVVRVRLDKKVAVVSMGALEVELPFDGLAAAPSGTLARGRKGRGKGKSRKPNLPATVAGTSEKGG